MQPYHFAWSEFRALKTALPYFLIIEDTLYIFSSSGESITSRDLTSANTGVWQPGRQFLTTGIHDYRDRSMDGVFNSCLGLSGAMKWWYTVTFLHDDFDFKVLLPTLYK